MQNCKIRSELALNGDQIENISQPIYTKPIKEIREFMQIQKKIEETIKQDTVEPYVNVYTVRDEFKVFGSYSGSQGLNTAIKECNLHPNAYVIDDKEVIHHHSTYQILPVDKVYMVNSKITLINKPVYISPVSSTIKATVDGVYYIGEDLTPSGRYRIKKDRNSSIMFGFINKEDIEP